MRLGLGIDAGEYTDTYCMILTAAGTGQGQSPDDKDDYTVELQRRWIKFVDTLKSGPGGIVYLGDQCPWLR